MAIGLITAATARAAGYAPGGDYRRLGKAVKETGRAWYVGSNGRRRVVFEAREATAVKRLCCDGTRACRRRDGFRRPPPGRPCRLVNWNEGLPSVWRSKLNCLVQRTPGCARSVEMPAYAAARRPALSSLRFPYTIIPAFWRKPEAKCVFCPPFYAGMADLWINYRKRNAAVPTFGRGNFDYRTNRTRY